MYALCMHVYIRKYVCMHYVCMHVSICMYACMYLCMYVCMYVCVYVCVFVLCMCLCMIVCMFVYVWAYVTILCRSRVLEEKRCDVICVKSHNAPFHCIQICYFSHPALLIVIKPPSTTVVYCILYTVL